MSIAFFIIMAFIVVAIFNYLKLNERGKGIPGPPMLPFIGNGHQVGIGDSTYFFKVLLNYVEIYGSRFRLFIGKQLIVVLTDVKDIEYVLSSNTLIGKAQEYNFFHDWLGTGLLTSTGEKWRKHRKIITPTFHFKILERFIQVFNDQCDTFLNRLKPHVDKDVFDLTMYVNDLTLDVMGEAAMGVNLDAQKKDKTDYAKAMKEILRIVFSAMRDPIRRSEFLFSFMADYQVKEKSLKTLFDFTNKLIQERREILEKEGQSFETYTAEDSNELGVKKKLAFLDMLLLSKLDDKPLSDIDIRNEVDTFLFEGHDTTASGIMFTLFAIAHHEDIQRKLYEEQRQIFAEDMNRTANYSDLQNMKYLELVIKEALRLYPSVPLLGRHVSENIQIGDMKIPAGSSLLLLVYALHRDPKLFPDPLKFIPERFTVEESKDRSPFAAVPFSAGPRNCIGQKFAMLEMKTVLSKCLRNYELLPSNEELLFTCDIILKSAGPVNIKIKDRMEY